MAETKEPFISQSDRPDVKIDPDKRVGELTVRDLRTILGDVAVLKNRGDIWPKIKDERTESDFRIIFGGLNLGVLVLGTDQLGNLKIVTPKERAEGAAGGTDDAGVNGFTRLVEHVGGLHKKIDELANQIAELKKPL
jgi:hypothetical protein